MEWKDKCSESVLFVQGRRVAIVQSMYSTQVVKTFGRIPELKMFNCSRDEAKFWVERAMKIEEVAA
jgi:hypothetical protein